MEWADIEEQGVILVVIDAKTGWMKAFPNKNRFTQTVRKSPSAVFARVVVLTKTLFSDNGPNLRRIKF